MSGFAENLDPAVRREMWGWFGPPWPSSHCLKMDPETGTDVEPREWDYSMRKPTPVGEKCLECEEEFQEGDQGLATPVMDTDRSWVAHVHRECQLRSVMGPLAHLEHRCSCFGGTDHDTPGLTRRQEAMAVWEWIRTHGVKGA